MSGTLNGDIITCIGQYSDINVGNNKNIYLTLSTYIIGMNYQFMSSIITANIFRRNVTAIGVNKIYDSTTTAPITLSGLVVGDLISLSNSIINFSDIFVGNNKIITLSGFLYGSIANNYNSVRQVEVIRCASQQTSWF